MSQMNYEYQFYTGSREGTASTISTDAPLPHIQVGHTLLLETSETSTTLGHHWEIQDVEVYLFAPNDSRVQRIVTRVMLRERARSPGQ
jgi:hypothetical protein